MQYHAIEGMCAVQAYVIGVFVYNGTVTFNKESYLLTTHTISQLGSADADR